MDQKIEVIWVNNPSLLPIAIQMQEHIHSCYQMYCCISGSSTFVVNGSELQICDGDVFYIPPNTPHCMLPRDHNSQWKTVEIKFLIHDEYLSSNLPQYSTVISGNALTKKMLQYVQTNWKSKNPNNVANIDSILYSLLLCFFMENIHYTEACGNIIDTSSYSSIVRSITTYIEENFYSGFSMDELSNALCYNRNYLSTLFSKETGISIVEYLNVLRVRQAVIAFSYYNRDVFAVCKSVGFCNTSHFSRKFKELVGVSPRSFKAFFSSPNRASLSEYYVLEPILNYSVCKVEDLFASFKRLGEAVKQFENQTII